VAIRPLIPLDEDGIQTVIFRKAAVEPSFLRQRFESFDPRFEDYLLGPVRFQPSNRCLADLQKGAHIVTGDDTSTRFDRCSALVVFPTLLYYLVVGGD